MEEKKQFGEVLNLEETAEYLRLCKTTVYSYVKKGILPGKKMGNKYRFSKKALDKFLEEKE